MGIPSTVDRQESARATNGKEPQKYGKLPDSRQKLCESILNLQKWEQSEGSLRRGAQKTPRFRKCTRGVLSTMTKPGERHINPSLLLNISYKICHTKEQKLACKVGVDAAEDPLGVTSGLLRPCVSDQTGFITSSHIKNSADDRRGLAHLRRPAVRFETTTKRMVCTMFEQCSDAQTVCRVFSKNTSLSQQTLIY